MGGDGYDAELSRHLYALLDRQGIRQQSVLRACALSTAIDHDFNALESLTPSGIFLPEELPNVPQFEGLVNEPTKLVYFTVQSVFRVQRHFSALLMPTKRFAWKDRDAAA